MTAAAAATTGACRAACGGLLVAWRSLFIRGVFTFPAVRIYLHETFVVENRITQYMVQNY